MSDPTIDPHLRAALRHAPDRDLAPPAAMDRAILEAARAAVAPRGRPPVARTGAGAYLRRALGAVFARPAGLAALASLAFASVIGWRLHDSRAPSEWVEARVTAPAPAHAPTPPAVPVPGARSQHGPAADRAAPQPARAKQAAPAEGMAAREAASPPHVASAEAVAAAERSAAAAPRRGLGLGLGMSLAGRDVAPDPPSQPADQTVPSAAVRAPAGVSKPAARVLPAPSLPPLAPVDGRALGAADAATGSDPLRLAVAEAYPNHYMLPLMRRVQQAASGRWQAVPALTAPALPRAPAARAAPAEREASAALGAGVTAPLTWHDRQLQPAGRMWLQDGALVWQDRQDKTWRVVLPADLTAELLAELGPAR